MRLALVSEDLRLPLDEGIKNTTAALVHALAGLVSTLLVVSAEPYTQEGACFLSIPSNKLLLGREFANLLRQFRPDSIIYIPSSSATPASFIRSAVLKASAGGIFTLLLGLQPRKYPPWARMLKLSAMVDLVVTQSSQGAQVLAGLGVRANWLPGGVDLKRFQPVDSIQKLALRKQYGFQPGERLVLHTGHINRLRNIELMCQLADNGLRPVVVGSTSTSQDQALYNQLQANGVTVLTDYMDSIEHLYQLADCYVFPVTNPASAIEVPLSVLEAMACNLPVVTTPFGGLPAMFPEGNGFYFLNEENDISWLVQHAIDTSYVATRAMVTPYAWETIARQLLAFLPQVGEVINE